MIAERRARTLLVSEPLPATLMPTYDLVRYAGLATEMVSMISTSPRIHCRSDLSIQSWAWSRGSVLAFASRG